MQTCTFLWHVRGILAFSKNALVWRCLFFWCTDNIGFLMSVWWLGIESQGNASESPQISKTVLLLLFMQCLTEWWCVLVWFVFFPGPHCFTMLLRTSVVVNHLQGCFQINPLWSPGSAVGKLPCCSRVLRSLNPSASLGQSSLMKSQYLDCTVPRICKHAA